MQVVVFFSSVMNGSELVWKGTSTTVEDLALSNAWWLLLYINHVVLQTRLRRDNILHSMISPVNKLLRRQLRICSSEASFVCPFKSELLKKKWGLEVCWCWVGGHEDLKNNSVKDSFVNFTAMMSSSLRNMDLVLLPNDLIAFACAGEPEASGIYASCWAACGEGNTDARSLPPSDSLWWFQHVFVVPRGGEGRSTMENCLASGERCSPSLH